VHDVHCLLQWLLHLPRFAASAAIAAARTIAATSTVATTITGATGAFRGESLH
jgi:hypothetical protein